jgi:HSP20 family molecular chaperone IbpA
MERTVDEAIQRAKEIYEMVAGHSAPEFSSDTPYARIPPEVDREEHVLRQAAALFQKVSDVVTPPARTAQARGEMPVPVATYRDGNDLRFVFDVGNTPRESVTCELRGPELRVTSEMGEQRNGHAHRFVQSAYLPARVDPSVVSAELSDGFLAVRVRMPIIDDAVHKIEIR